MHEGGEGTIRSPSVGPRCGKSGTSIVVEETAGIACPYLMLSSIPAFRACMITMLMSPLGHKLERATQNESALSLSLHVCVQIRRLGVLECVMLVQAASVRIYEVWVVM